MNILKLLRRCFSSLFEYSSTEIVSNSANKTNDPADVIKFQFFNATKNGKDTEFMN